MCASTDRPWHHWKFKQPTPNLYGASFPASETQKLKATYHNESASCADHRTAPMTRLIWHTSLLPCVCLTLLISVCRDMPNSHLRNIALLVEANNEFSYRTMCFDFFPFTMWVQFWKFPLLTLKENHMEEQRTQLPISGLLRETGRTGNKRWSPLISLYVLALSETVGCILHSLTIIPCLEKHFCHIY